MDYTGHVPANKSPVQDLIDEIIQKSNEAREHILYNLIENPGFVSTFDNNFVFEFGDIEIHTHVSPELNPLDEYRFDITQTWRIRRRKEEDAARTALGGDSRGEEHPDRQDSGDEQQATFGLRLLP